MLHVHVHPALHCLCCMSMFMLLVHVDATCPYAGCISMPMLHVNAACPYCISILHVPVARPCCMSMLHTHAVCPWCMLMQHAHTSWTCYMLMLHGHAGYPCYMSMPHDMLHVHAECKCCTWMSISPCCTSLLSSHVHAACPCCICCMSMLHVCPMLYAHATYWMKTMKWTKDMQYAHTARTCCMDMHHGHAGYRWRMDIALCPWLSAACPSCKPMLHVHASWHAAWTFYMKMLHEHVACTSCMSINVNIKMKVHMNRDIGTGTDMDTLCLVSLRFFASFASLPFRFAS
jgi:hypothetical protein